MRFLILFGWLLLASLPAHAYIGPGMGAGAIATALGVLGAIFLAILAVIYYPIKRLIKGRKKVSADEAKEGP